MYGLVVVVGGFLGLCVVEIFNLEGRFYFTDWLVFINVCSLVLVCYLLRGFFSFYRVLFEDFYEFRDGVGMEVFTCVYV